LYSKSLLREKKKEKAIIFIRFWIKQHIFFFLHLFILLQMKSRNIAALYHLIKEHKLLPEYFLRSMKLFF